MSKINLINEDKIIEFDGIKTLYEVLVDNNIYIDSPCGGKGSCGKCLVKINNEPVYKLACQTPATEDMTVQIISSKPEEEKILVDGTMMELDVDPEIKKSVVTPEKLTYESESLVKAIERSYKGSINFSYYGYCQLSRIYEQNFEEITLTLDEDGLVLDIEAVDNSEEVYGIAIDLGTTTAAGYLWDLNKGERIVSSSQMNKQSPYGADVISRINYTRENEDGIKILQEKALETINYIIDDLCDDAKINKTNIYQLILVGNTTMNHLFLGFNPNSLGKSPYLPVTQSSVEVKAKDLSVNINPYGKVQFMPNIAGFVGSDTVGAILASQLNEIKKELLIDLGTNGEIVVTGNGKILACSTAAGPAFEGAKISQGMQASSGAISKVEFNNDNLLYTTIGNANPKGICGSGLMDIVAVLVNEGVINKTGKFESPDNIKSKDLAKRVTTENDEIKFAIAFPEETDNGEGVYIKQKDIREVQLAKGAVAAGIKSLLKAAEISYDDLENIYLAGAFGNYVDVKSIQTLGVIPQIEKGNIVPVGNAAGSGCQMALVNKTVHKEAEKLIHKIDHIELASRPDFQNTFMESMYF